MPEPSVFTLEEMKNHYGQFFESAALLNLDRARVPQKLWPILPYAAFWGAADDWTRESLARKAPIDVRQNLKAIVAAFDDALDEWLAGNEAKAVPPSAEYVAFSAM